MEIICRKLAWQTTYLYKSNAKIFIMNLLAHAYLSFGNPPVLVGNMISDYVKGKKQFTYDSAIQKGILLHRAIDDFTDHHTATQGAKFFFKEDYRLYSGAFVDVVYDHFLANDPLQFASADALFQFAQTVYDSLEQYQEIMPERFGKTIPYMRAQNWLYNYRLKEGIQRSFEGLAKRAAYLQESAIAFSIFEEHYEELKVCYQSFFPDLKRMAENWYQEHIR